MAGTEPFEDFGGEDGFFFVGLAVAGFFGWTHDDDASVEVDLIPAQRGGVLDAEAEVVAEQDHRSPVIVGGGENVAQFGEGKNAAFGGVVA